MILICKKLKQKLKRNHRLITTISFIMEARLNYIKKLNNRIIMRVVATSLQPDQVYLLTLKPLKG